MLVRCKDIEGSEFREILLQSMRILESFTKDIFEKGNKQQVFDFYELGLNKTNIDYFDVRTQKWGSYVFCVPDNCGTKIFSNPPKDDNELRFIIDTYCNTEELLRLFNMLKEKDLNKKDLKDAIKLYELEMYKPCVLLIYSLIDKAKDNGADIVKQWDATLDSRTRPHYTQLYGQIKELDKPFEIAGRKAMCSSGFSIASEDIHCRCVLLQRNKWALDEKELQTLKERSEYYKLDETKDFVDFKNKYLGKIDNIIYK